MIVRVLASIVIAVEVAGCALPPLSGTTRWNPDSAVRDAERDIASSRIQFAYVGGYAPSAVGLPETRGTYAILGRYGRLEVGPQGCIQDEHWRERDEYARRYNQRMWSYVSKHR